MTDRLLTSVVGSHARPSWFVSGIDAAERGEFGPADLSEMLSRPLARRTYRPVLDAMLRFDVDELGLEFANREMAEIELLAEITAAGRHVAAGVIDIKNYHLETAEEVAERTEAILETGVPPERLTLVPDCGFSQTARWATRAKLSALVAGRDLVLGQHPVND